MGKSGNKSQDAKSTVKKTVNAKHEPPKNGGKCGLTGKEYGIVEALAKLHAVDITQPSRDMVCAMSGNGKTREGFKKNMGALRKKGYLEFPDSSTVSLTEKGSSAVGTVDPESITNESFQEEMIKPLISKKAALIFDAISDGEVHQKDEVARALNYNMDKLSGYNKDLSNMSSLGFLEKKGANIQLTDKCFPRGRPE